MVAQKSVEKTAGMGDAAVHKATGKTWEEWLRVLDKAGCKKMTHKEIVAHLSEEHGVGSWWRQMVTVGYERARGLRQKHEVVDGFRVGRSKTMTAPVEMLFAAWKDKKRRGKWLEDADFTIRTAIENKTLRITWIDGVTRLEVQFTPKGAEKSVVAVEHSRLKNEKEAAQKKEYWGRQLSRLEELLKE
jgi:uncharacterized protein YndB with AHSA1/START domain